MLEKIQEINLTDTAEMRGLNCKKCVLSNLPRENINIELRIYLHRLLSTIILWKEISDEKNIGKYIDLLLNPEKVLDDLESIRDLCTYSKKCRDKILKEKGLLYYRYGLLLIEIAPFIESVDLLVPYRILYSKGIQPYLSFLLSEVSPSDEEHLRKKIIDLTQRFLSYSCEKPLSSVERTIMSYHRLIV